MGQKMFAKTPLMHLEEPLLTRDVETPQDDVSSSNAKHVKDLDSADGEEEGSSFDQDDSLQSMRLLCVVGQWIWPSIVASLCFVPLCSQKFASWLILALLGNGAFLLCLGCVSKRNPVQRIRKENLPSVIWICIAAIWFVRSEIYGFDELVLFVIIPGCFLIIIVVTMVAPLYRKFKNGIAQMEKENFEKLQEKEMDEEAELAAQKERFEHLESLPRSKKKETTGQTLETECLFLCMHLGPVRWDH